MTVAITYSRAHLGMVAPEVTIEAHLSGGLPAFSIVGLAEAAVREAKDRVRSAILNSQFDFPNARITVNMAPADLPKQPTSEARLAVSESTCPATVHVLAAE